MSRETKHSNTFRIWVRIVAGFLAVFFAVFMVLIDMTRVKLSTDTGSDIENAAAGLLAENTDYVSKTGFERVEDVISNLFTNPETFDNYYKLASMQIGQGRYEKALVNVERCLHEYKGTQSSILDDLYMKKACVETLLGDYDAALDSFDKISSGSSESFELLRIKAQIFIERGQLADAKEAILAYLSEYPDDMETREILAQVYYLSEEFELSLTQYSRLIDEYGDEGGAWHFMRGMLYEQISEYTSAVSEFTTAIGLGFSDTAVCYEQQSLCYYFMGDYESAVRQGQQALKIGSQDLDEAKLYKYMALSAMSSALYEDSAAYFTKSIEKAEQATDEYYFRGVCYMALGSFESAIIDFTASIDIGQLQPECFYNRALCYLQTGKTKEARKDLEDASALSGNAELSASIDSLLRQLK